MRMSKSLKLISKNYDALIKKDINMPSIELYLESIDNMLSAYKAMKRAEYANTEAYNTSIKMFDDKYGFSFITFIQGSYEYHVAKAYVLLCMIALRDKLSFRDVYTETDDFIMNSFSSSLSYIFTGGFSNVEITKAIFQLEVFCKNSDINLYFYVELVVHNVLLIKLGLRERLGVRDQNFLFNKQRV